MATLNNIKIGRRLTYTFLIIIVITMAAFGYSTLKIKVIKQQIEEIYKVNLLGIDFLIEADRDAYQSNLAIAQSFHEAVYNTPDKMKAATAAVWENFDQIATRYKSFEESFRIAEKPEFTARNTEFHDFYTQLRTETENIINFLSSGKRDTAEEFYYSTYNNTFESMRTIMNEFTEKGLANAEMFYNESNSLSTKIYRTTIILSIIITILFVLAAILLTRSITIPLLYTVEAIRNIASGDLTKSIIVKGKDETAELLIAIGNMSDKLKTIIKSIIDSSQRLSSSSMQFSGSSQQMSQGASEQASSAEEVSSSMEEMAANIQQNTENAQQTEKIAMNAAEGINKVSLGSENTLKYMQDIADKVSIIGEIARQTNILALNAAVEAARAGDHGKGFAVVAAEVRKLAERSQISAVEIDSLTKNSVRATEESVRLLGSLTPEIGKTAKLVQEIAAASMEQNSGADQVNNAIQQLNQVTQQNAAASEEIATSSEELATQAQHLLEMISFFKLDDEESVKHSAAIEKMKSASKTIVYKTNNEKPVTIPQSSGKISKGVTINMGRDHIDSNYERF